MKFKSILIYFLINFYLILFSQVFSQKKDTIIIDKTNAEEINILNNSQHSPKKATIFSAILPGLGQAYNKQFWKIPILYAGFGTLIYFAKHNHKLYKAYKKSYEIRIDGDEKTIDEYFFLSETDLLNLKNSAMRYRDLNYILIFGVYFLNIIDATVGAHFFDYDVNENLSLKIIPEINNNYSYNNYNIKLLIKFNLKN
ncbi:MAG: hypothetical protein B6I24_06485 [Bacteroidetes bacterium 4572_128]|nr:MAG: hypothetical protein B6I24_06485 [Bacteroidetes bacterium 4572_128]